MSDTATLLWVIGQARALLGKVRQCDTANSLANVEKLIAFMDAHGYKSADKIDAATPSLAGGGEVGAIETAPFYWERGGGAKQDAATGYCNGWNDCVAANRRKI